MRNVDAGPPPLSGRMTVICVHNTTSRLTMGTKLMGTLPFHTYHQRCPTCQLRGARVHPPGGHQERDPPLKERGGLPPVGHIAVGGAMYTLAAAARTAPMAAQEKL